MADEKTNEEAGYIRHQPEEDPGTIRFYQPGDRVIFSISAEGRLTLGEFITWDEAAQTMLEALQRLTGREIVRVERATPTRNEVKAWLRDHTAIELDGALTDQIMRWIEAASHG